MRISSSYLRHLPPVLWADEAPAAQLHLGEMLCLFEKFLTGINDGVTLTDSDLPNREKQDEKEEQEQERLGPRIYPPLQETIAKSADLFGPWTVPVSIDMTASPLELPPRSPMDWLSQWVALRLSPAWNEYQRRKALSEIVQIYAQRGTKAGLNKLIELHAGSSLRPRVVIDDASKVLFTRPTAGFSAPIHTLVSQLPLIAPQCIALGPDGNLYVADLGNKSQDFPNLPVQKAAVWRISPSGEYDYDKNSVPLPIGAPALDLTAPRALAIDRLRHFGVYVLDGSGGSTQLFRFSSANFAASVEPLATGAALGSPKLPAAMIVSADNDVLILDRGDAPNGCRIIQVKVSGDPPTFQSAQSHALAEVRLPLSLTQLRDGRIVIGDGGDQTQGIPARLWQLLPSGEWRPEPLLSNDDPEKNPLVAPTAVIQGEANELFVLDGGLKPFTAPQGHPFNRLIARQAAVYRVHAPAGTNAALKVDRVTETQQLVFPRGMARAPDGLLYICDSGLPDIQGYRARAWRSLPLAFAVVVHFGGGLNTRPEDLPARRRLLQSIREVIEHEHPVQSFWTLQTESR